MIGFGFTGTGPLPFTEVVNSAAAPVVPAGQPLTTDPISYRSRGAPILLIERIFIRFDIDKSGESYWSSDGGVTVLPPTNVPAGALVYAGNGYAGFAARLTAMGITIGGDAFADLYYSR